MIGKTQKQPVRLCFLAYYERDLKKNVNDEFQKKFYSKFKVTRSLKPSNIEEYMDTQSKHLTVNPTPNHFVGNDHKDVQIYREGIQKKCEEFIANFKKQLDDYIISRESLSFVEFITFGTDLTKTRIKFAHTISNKLSEFLSSSNTFNYKNFDKLMVLIKDIKEENNKKLMNI